MTPSHPVTPSDDQLAELASTRIEGPVVMLNLLRFRATAAYPDGRDGGTGADAYGRYAEVAMRKVTERGGRLLYAAAADQTVIGPSHEKWDQIAIVEYPNRAAFLDMVQDPEYLDAHVHREAGLEDTRLIATTPVVPFG